MNETEHIRDGKVRLVAIPLLALAICLFFNAFFYIEFGIPVWKILLSNLAFTVAAFESTRFVVIRARGLYPQWERAVKRYLLIALGILVTALWVGPCHLHFEKDVLFHDASVKTGYDYFSVVGSTLFFSLVIAGFYEAGYFFRQWDKSSREKEQLAKVNLETRYELLKNQVQPHFLFNSLNTLTALVDENPAQAKKFIKELALVYRHLLQSNEKSLVPLGEELQFIHAYVFLLKTRFEEGIVWEENVDENSKDFLIPPLTLQILLENVVKHNRIEASHPLRVQVYVHEGMLRVKNNLLKKTVPVYSSRLGLANVISKYRLMGYPNVQVEETNVHFMVSLPLIPLADEQTSDKILTHERIDSGR